MQPSPFDLRNQENITYIPSWCQQKVCFILLFVELEHWGIKIHQRSNDEEEIYRKRKVQSYISLGTKRFLMLLLVIKLLWLTEVNAIAEFQISFQPKKWTQGLRLDSLIFLTILLIYALPQTLEVVSFAVFGALLGGFELHLTVQTVSIPTIYFKDLQFLKKKLVLPALPRWL